MPAVLIISVIIIQLSFVEYKYHAVFVLVLFPRPRERLKTFASQNFGKKKTKGAGEKKPF